MLLESLVVPKMQTETPLGYFIENQIARSLEFTVRSKLKKDPTLDPRIKIFAFDSSTVNGLGKDDLELEEWGKVFSNIASHNPKIILVDKVFGTPRGMQRVESFKKMMAKIETPIVVDCYVQLQNFMKKNFVAPESKSFDLVRMLEGSGEPATAINELEWLKTEVGTIVGPIDAVQSSFKLMGHANGQKFGYVKPLIRVDHRWAVPHWSFFAAESLNINESGLHVNDFSVPLNNQGFIIPNLISLDELQIRTKQFLSVAYRSLNNMPLDSIHPNDVVIILPAMYPGNKDWIDTPRGREQGGYVMSALVNSVLTGKWLRQAGGVLPLVMLTCLLGFVMAICLSPLVLFSALVGISIVAAGCGLLSFSYLGIILPWFYPVCGIIVTGTLVFAERARVNDLRLANLRASLNGKLSNERIEHIAKNPMLMQAGPSGRIVSIMFIDIVGFSQLSERQTPQQAFLELKVLFELLRSIVLKNHGVVDKTLGDGMLCYFGYGPDGEEYHREHADLALTCAIKVQEAVLEKNLKAASIGKAIYPLRIGINTASVFVENIGDVNHFDFTMIGNGVNLAKRFESACQHYCIMIGSTTYDTILNRDGLPGKLTKRLIPIKHSDTPVEAYECDPFYNQEKAINDANAAYRKSIGVDRKDQRWPVPKGIDILLESKFGRAKLFNFSQSGFGVILDKYIGNGVQIDFVIEIPESSLQNALTGEVTLVGEVRWGRPMEQGYLHGILIKNLSNKQKNHLVNAFRAIVQEDNS